jgi:hypothetical protein
MSNPFARPDPVIAPPIAAPPPTMPDPMSPDALAAKRKAEQDIMGRAGRSSTILSTAMTRGDSSAPYSSTKLGTGA